MLLFLCASDSVGGLPVRCRVVRRECSEQLMRSKRAFVFHGLAFADEVAHVDPLQAAVACVLQFLKNGPGADPGLSPFGGMVEVDAAEAGFGDIDQPQSDELSGMSVLEFAGEREVAIDEGFVVVFSGDFSKRPATSLVHIAVIAVVESDMFGSQCWLLYGDFDLLLIQLFTTASLAA